jgi:hypothetical protein
MSVIPIQDTYLSPFCDDSPEGLGQWISVYNLFVRRGNYTYVGQNSIRFSTLDHLSAPLPNVSARVYDNSGYDFEMTASTASTVTLRGGIVVVNNTVIELEGFTTNFSELAGHWAPGNLYGTWNFSNNSTDSAFMCVLYDPYMPDGTINPTEPGARIVYVTVGDLDYSVMAPIWLIKVTKTGSTVTNVQLLLETVGVTPKVEQIGYWKNFIVDGGNFV